MRNYNDIITTIESSSDEDIKHLFERLEDYYETKQEVIDAIADDDDLSDTIDEISDGDVSCYTSHRFDWLNDHRNEADEALEEAAQNWFISTDDFNGLSFDRLIGIAWCVHNENTNRQALEDLRALINDVPQLDDVAA